MKKLLPLAALSATLLASCNLLGVPNGDVTGNISNVPTLNGKTLRIALVGKTFGTGNNSAVTQIAVTPSSTGAYAITLPSGQNDGGYDVVAYVDANGNGTYDSGEQRTQDSGYTLVYSANGGSAFGYTVPKGWSRWKNGATAPQESSPPFRNYDLAFSTN